MLFPAEKVKRTLLDLLHTPSPTGRAERAIRYVEHRLNACGLVTRRTNKGGILVTLSGRNDEVHRFLTAHVDTLGAMVKEIKENGRLKLSAIGGFGWFAVDGAYCGVETREGKVIPGTILASCSSVHVYKYAREKVRDDDLMEVRLDARVKTADDVRELGVRVGDIVWFDPQVVETEAGFIKVRHLDDKAGVAILLELIEHFVRSGILLPHTTHVLFSNYEEVGYGANSNIPSKVREYVAVDMGAIGRGQATDEFCVSICAKDSTGPYHWELTTKLIRLAEENGIYYQVDIYPHYGSDAGAAVLSGADVMHALIGPGVDASHAYERTHLDALDNTYRLLYHYLLTESL
jgi:putative aminopeptidase FrvX